jgi:hypothetical protein
MSFPKWFIKNDEKKLFHEQPTEVGWEYAGGHYDFALGIWIDDEPEEIQDVPDVPPEPEDMAPRKPGRPRKVRTEA